MRPLFFILLTLACPSHAAIQRPNILWITSEDNGHYLRSFGDPMARTPNLDWLARGSTRFTHCFSNAAVCAPARQTLISGMYATSIGGQHMRANATFPEGVHYFPKYLRAAGYYTSNNSKTDYNGGPADREGAMKAAWDESGRKAHWRNRPKGKPFFSVFNIGSSHESNLFASKWKKRELKTDPAKVNLPAYLPDLPETRRDLARYYDCIETMDESVGKILRELGDDGLAEDTIVFYFGDHGGSLPRGKSFTYDSGTRVPLIVHIPEKWESLRATEPGGETDRLASFVDFAPTVLSLVNIAAPDYMQGQSFLGKSSEAREFVHTFRGRRGERYDLVRGVRSKDFLYLRNYTPHLPVMQYNDYSSGIPSYGAWRNAIKAGNGTPDQAQWFVPKAREEFYDTRNDPDNVHNLMADPKYAKILARHRIENKRHMASIRDSAFFPEGMSGRDYAKYQDEKTYPLGRLQSLANATKVSRFIEAMKDDDPKIRYWGVMGCIVHGQTTKELKRLLEDPEPLIRIQAARAICGTKADPAGVAVLREQLQAKDQILQLRAALAVDECNLIQNDPSLAALLKNVRGQYGKRVATHILTKAKRAQSVD